MTNIGLAYLFEYFVLNLFKAYTYRPKIMSKSYLDIILGAILSQAVYVPVSATFLAVFKKSWKWKLSFSLFYFLIENLFLRLKVYAVNWWKPFYSIILLTVYFFISSVIYRLLLHHKRWALKIAHYLTMVIIDVNLMYINAVRNKVRFGRGFHFSWREHFIIAPLYSLFIAFITGLFSRKSGIHFRLLNLLSNQVINLVLMKKKILKMKLNYILESVLSHLFLVGVSRLLYKKMLSEAIGGVRFEGVSSFNRYLASRSFYK
ncbi:hypothetical protein ACLM5H_03235 [Fredinandcohnia humi]